MAFDEIKDVKECIHKRSFAPASIAELRFSDAVDDQQVFRYEFRFNSNDSLKRASCTATITNVALATRKTKGKYKRTYRSFKH